MKIIRTHEMNPSQLSEWERDQVYNGLDVCVTHDVFAGTVGQLDNYTAATYNFSRELQGPVLEMGIRGILVDQARRADVIDELYDQQEFLERRLERIVFDGIGMLSFNWRSNADLQRLFYGELGIPPIKKSGRPTTDRNARERLENYPIATQLVRHINALTELGDKISVLKTRLDADGRIRTSYNIAGTNTGRFSSSFSEFGTGGNLQNIEESLRSMFIADYGYKFAKCDAKSGESFCVGAIEGNLFDDWTYLDACESGDPHTAVARIVWPGLPWTGVLNDDKALAEQPFFRHYSHRFMCKKLGHGSNYGGRPATLAQQTQLPIGVVQQFQPKYFQAFPAHQAWQSWVDNELRQRGYLIGLTGRKRWFFGRRNDPSTLREAIAYDPQGSLADIVNRAMRNIWRQNIVIIVKQDHDAITFMYPEETEDTIIPQIMSQLIIPIDLRGGRQLRIPYDCQVGWNMGKWSEKNPDGLRDFKGHDERKRTPKAGVLDTVLRRTNRKSTLPSDIPAMGGDISTGRGVGAEGMD